MTRERRPLIPMASAPATADPAAARTPRRRRRVYMTGRLAASAAVLAMSVQAGQGGPVEDDITPCTTCGDPAGPGSEEAPETA